MDTLLRGQRNSGNGFDYNHNDYPFAENLTRDLYNGCQFENRFSSDRIPGHSNGSSSQLPVNGEGESQVEGDYFDGVFKYIQEMLMEEEELENRPCMLQDCLALQAAEKIFYKVLHDDDDPSSHCRSPTPAFSGQGFDNPSDDFASIWNNQEKNGFSASGNDSFVHSQTFQPNFQTINYCDNMYGNQDFNRNQRKAVGQGRNSGEENSNEGRNVHSREDNSNDDDQNLDQRRSKRFAGYTEEIEETEVYDDALLCPGRNPNFYGESSSIEEEGIIKKPSFQPQKPKRGRPKAGEKRGGNSSSIKEIVDLRDLLTRCAHSVACHDNATAQELTKKIRQNSSPYGSATERLARFFVNALEARIAGTGTSLYSTLTTRRASASDILKSYETYLTICPFQRMSNIFANKSIAKATSSATRVHIIDFGILYGFQWPCIIHGISLRPGGPPKLRITGIDLPQPGFRPAERIEETGRRLASFCKRFDVPFEFNAIAKRWDAISLEELKIEKDEMVVVNCLYRLRNAPDETVVESNPRDAVIKFIKKINPHVFVHGVLNAGYNAPFFTTRFKEALHHFSSMFDIFEANLPPEDQERFMFEREVLGRDVMNVIACEGAERVDRPDSYKQWQVRNQRAGFRQVALDKKIMNEIKVKVKASYHKEFLIDEDCKWMLQGWKGRVIYALSCWKPAT
ncbi:hypothetical protein M9H77_15848 [Catharanthus roseus]|uniref:Uncharacterized protein n=1 Tax=Catharanthus roseus TaxID=4058 RepID=A0ACC0AYR1_CATRO|nr:hypothetical protein M9H77_15848 [Catharanthus roseus]